MSSTTAKIEGGTAYGLTLYVLDRIIADHRQDFGVWPKQLVVYPADWFEFCREMPEHGKFVPPNRGTYRPLLGSEWVIAVKQDGSLSRGTVISYDEEI